MNSPGLGDGLPASSRREREQIINRFEDDWQTGTPPRLESYCKPLDPAGTASNDPARLLLLRDLLKIDLEYRWKRAGSGQNPGIPRLNQYCEHYPEILACEQLLLEVIGEEYRVRHRWGDRPKHGEYLKRYGSRQPTVLARLQRIDAELAAEIIREGRPPTSSVPTVPPGILGGKPVVPAAITTVQSLLDALRQHQLVTPGQVPPPVLAEFQRRFADPRALARELIERGWLTAYQINQLFQGRASDLVIGSYLLLERLGEGGAGQVFKARHLHMNRTVALKLIRKELLTDREIVDRFQREVHALSKLTHPHVIQAYDAGPVGANFFLAMEYVEGIDLARLVKLKQPLAVAQACDYVWQAAIGFQHLHEHGLVHRDVKPSNLLVTGLLAPATSPPATPSANSQSPPWGVVKILDLGLARLHRPIDEATAGLTADKSLMMGTLDYMAPEQAMDFHQADIRSDIYSLGCSFYFLLTGRPPFPECTLAQKLHRHQHAEPIPAEQFRRDLPPAVTPLLRQMMAKRPEDRFQSPGEVAQALAPMIATSPNRSFALVPSKASPGNLSPAPITYPLVPAGRPLVVVNMATSRTGRAVEQLLDWLQRRPSRQRRRFLLAAGIGVFITLSLCVWLTANFFWGKPAEPEEVFLSDLVPVEVRGGPFGNQGFLNIYKGIDAVVAGRRSPKGLITKPPDGGATVVIYRLDRKYKLFHTTVGSIDSNGSSDTYQFSVVGDGKILWESRRIGTRGDSETPQPIDVRGVDRLELTVSNKGDHSGPMVWFEPKLTK